MTEEEIEGESLNTQEKYREAEVISLEPWPWNYTGGDCRGSLRRRI